MKHILQKHKDSCLIACFAMVADISYDKALKIVYPRRKKGSRVKSINFFKIMPYLCKFGLFPVPRFWWGNMKDIRKIERHAILLIENKNCSWDHAVVWDTERKKILDPGRARAVTMRHYQNNLKYYIELF